jgi:hypothetical protein
MTDLGRAATTASASGWPADEPEDHPGEYGYRGLVLLDDHDDPRGHPTGRQEDEVVRDGSGMDQQFVRVVDVLAERFAGVHTRETIVRVVAEARASLEAEARVTLYLPVLTTRRAADLLAGRRPVPLS